MLCFGKIIFLINKSKVPNRVPTKLELRIADEANDNEAGYNKLEYNFSILSYVHILEYNWCNQKITVIFIFFRKNLFIYQ